MSEYLLDSDIIIWYLRGRKEVVELVRRLKVESIPGCSPLSVIEVQIGVKKGEEQATNLFLEALREYPVTREIAKLGASYIKKYKSQGMTIDIVDAIIAATCAVHHLILVTYNVDHYPMSDVKLYPIDKV